MRGRGSTVAELGEPADDGLEPELVLASGIAGRSVGFAGKENAGAPKVGWCWAGNRHTWLGFASARTRSA